MSNTQNTQSCLNMDQSAATTTFQVNMLAAVRTMIAASISIDAPVVSMETAMDAIAERLGVHPLMLTISERDERTTEVRIGSGTGLVATVVSL